MTSELPQVTVSNTPRPAKPNRDVLTAAKGSGIFFVGRIVAYISRFAIAFLLARLLGAQEFGLYNLARTAAIMSGTIAAFGLNTALMRFIAISRARRDEAGVWGVIQVGIGLTTFLGIAVGVGLYLLAEPIAIQIFDEPALIPLLWLGSLVVPFAALANVVATATRGFKTMQYAVMAESVLKPLFRLALIIALVLIGLNAVVALIIFGVAELAQFIIALYFLHKLFSLKRPLNTARRDIREVLSFSIPVYLTNLVQLTRGNVQTILLGAMYNVTSVGVFIIASRVNLINDMFISAIAGSATPIIADLYGRGKRKQIGHLYQIASKWIVTFNLPFFLAIILFPEAILSLFGESFTNGSAALVILAWAGMVNAGTGICGNVLDMTGHTRLKLFNSVVSMVASVGFNLWLIPQYGMVGAAITALIVASTINGLRIIEIFILMRLLPYNFTFLKPITAGLVALAATSLTAKWFSIEINLIYIVPQLLILFTVYIGVTILLGISPEDQVVLTRLRQRTSKILS